MINTFEAAIAEIPGNIKVEKDVFRELSLMARSSNAKTARMVLEWHEHDNAMIDNEFIPEIIFSVRLPE